MKKRTHTHTHTKAPVMGRWETEALGRTSFNLKREPLTCQNQKIHRGKKKKKRGLGQGETIGNKAKEQFCVVI